MTISPPPKVNPESLKPFQILVSGVDSLYLAFHITWRDDSFFKLLTKTKELAKEMKNIFPLILRNNDETDECVFSVKPHGADNYEWLLVGNEYSLKIGKWLKPIHRPNIIEIRSETLWRLGAKHAVDRILNLIKVQNGHIETVKVSRVDLCLDLTFPPEKWNERLRKLKVTKANKFKPNYYSDRLEGFSIGKGQISARLYDKPFEIVQKSGKKWMYSIWGIEDIPEDLIIVRIEFQLRRTGLTSLGIDTIDDLFSYLDNVWAFCTQNWLKFQNNPGKHHTQRKTLPWWKKVQNTFLGVQDATPLIRSKAINAQIKQLFRQAYGLLVAICALKLELHERCLNHEITIKDLLSIFEEIAEEEGKNDFALNVDILDKRTKYNRARQKMYAVHKKRKELGHPSRLP